MAVGLWKLPSGCPKIPWWSSPNSFKSGSAEARLLALSGSGSVATSKLEVAIEWVTVTSSSLRYFRLSWPTSLARWPGNAASRASWIFSRLRSTAPAGMSSSSIFAMRDDDSPARSGNLQSRLRSDDGCRHQNSATDRRRTARHEVANESKMDVGAVPELICWCYHGECCSRAGVHGSLGS